jgi:hypothetical protein
MLKLPRVGSANAPVGAGQLILFCTEILLVSARFAVVVFQLNRFLHCSPAPNTFDREFLNGVRTAGR